MCQEVDFPNYADEGKTNKKYAYTMQTILLQNMTIT